MTEDEGSMCLWRVGVHLPVYTTLTIQKTITDFHRLENLKSLSEFCSDIQIHSSPGLVYMTLDVWCFQEISSYESGSINIFQRQIHYWIWLFYDPAPSSDVISEPCTCYWLTAYFKMLYQPQGFISQYCACCWLIRSVFENFTQIPLLPLLPLKPSAARPYL
jgi:hypothetical protein